MPSQSIRAPSSEDRGRAEPKTETFEIAALVPSRWIVMIRRAIPAFATLIALSQTATAGVPSCAAVRFYVAKYSQAAAEMWARGHGASDAEIETARRCLHSANVQTASSAVRSQVPAPITAGARPARTSRTRSRSGLRCPSYLCKVSAPTPSRIIMTTNQVFMASSARRISRIVSPGMRAPRLKIPFASMERLTHCAHAMWALCIAPTVRE